MKKIVLVLALALIMTGCGKKSVKGDGSTLPTVTPRITEVVTPTEPAKEDIRKRIIVYDEKIISNTVDILRLYMPESEYNEYIKGAPILEIHYNRDGEMIFDENDKNIKSIEPGEGKSFTVVFNNDRTIPGYLTEDGKYAVDTSNEHVSILSPEYFENLATPANAEPTTKAE